jgi:hypothetical protein
MGIWPGLVARIRNSYTVLVREPHYETEEMGDNIKTDLGKLRYDDRW